MKTLRQVIIIFFVIILTSGLQAQYNNRYDEFVDIEIDTIITQIQPMTGIVFWQDQHQSQIQEVTSLEFSYMLFNDVVVDSGDYNWDIVESKLDDIASRQHQAIFRFRYTYVGRETSVPYYIKQLDDYHETEGMSEGQLTWFPDWTNAELQRFSLEFYTKFAERYDNDPRLAFIQVGFGLWAEYHIYDGPFELGVTFPSKEFQISFFNHLDTTLIVTPFSISIDAADDTYSPFSQDEELYDINFGLFDDSFMHQNHSGYNTECWNFFGRNRYEYNPAGGEFSYYSSYDQQHVLDWPDGPYGIPYETFAEDFHISYIIGNGQSQYQTANRIKKAGIASGYKFKIVSFKASADSSVIVIKNSGVAPIYYDAYVTVNGIRSAISLIYLQPNETIECSVSAGGENPTLTIESDRLVPGQTIGYLGTVNYASIEDNISEKNIAKVYPTILKRGSEIIIQKQNINSNSINIEVIASNGNIVQRLNAVNNSLLINTSKLSSGYYIIRISDNEQKSQSQKVIIL